MLKQQITKDELYRRLAVSAGVSEEAAAKMVEELARITAAEVGTNGGFLLPGVGMIEILERFERSGVNPATGDKVKIGPSVKLKFEFATRFKNVLQAR
jgi:nucleoid DNA-binding protein